MNHISDEQLSAYIDGQLFGEEKQKAERHIQDCALCSAASSEMYEVTRLFRNAARVEPSPFVWNRIEAGLDAARPRVFGWKNSTAARLRSFSLNPSFAAAAVVFVLIAAFVLVQFGMRDFSERAALAEIDRAHRSLMAYDGDFYNPFSSGSPPELDANPFRSLRLSSTGNDSAPTAPQH